MKFDPCAYMGNKNLPWFNFSFGYLIKVLMQFALHRFWNMGFLAPKSNLKFLVFLFLKSYCMNMFFLQMELFDKALLEKKKPRNFKLHQHVHQILHSPYLRTFNTLIFLAIILRPIGNKTFVTLITTSVGSPESGRTTRVPSLFSTRDFSCCPQTFSHAFQMS